MKKRAITAVGIVALILVLYILPSNLGRIAIALGVAALSTLAYKETLNLKESHHEYKTGIIILGWICLELLVFNRINASYIYTGVSFGMIGLTTLLLILPSIFDKKGKYTTKDALYLVGSNLTIGLFFNLLMLIFMGDKWLLLYLLLIATMTDTFAMLIGCLIGKHKLIPDVSPKKSVEGSVAGSFVGTAIASIYYFNVIAKMNIFGLIAMTLVLSILGQLGDLFFSKIKRENDIKDFSNLMPGHGGILDRVDSLVFIVYGYAVIINLINLF